LKLFEEAGLKFIQKKKNLNPRFKEHYLLVINTIESYVSTFFSAFTDSLFANSDFESQNSFVIEYMNPTLPKRKRSPNASPLTRLSCEYKFPLREGSKIPICANSFSSITLMSECLFIVAAGEYAGSCSGAFIIEVFLTVVIAKKRLNNIADFLFRTGRALPERRYASMKIEEQKAARESIMKHISSLRYFSSRYADENPRELTLRRFYQWWKQDREFEKLPTASFVVYKDVSFLIALRSIMR
jgi:hypothetical protein